MGSIALQKARFVSTELKPAKAASILSALARREPKASKLAGGFAAQPVLASRLETWLFAPCGG